MRRALYPWPLVQVDFQGSREAASGAMGWYARYCFPRLMDYAMRGPEAEALRAETLAGARGEVLEVGFGTGLNARHYAAPAERVVGLEPNPGMMDLALRRASRSAVPIELVQGGAEALPFADHSFDTVITTATLCSIPEVERALVEIRRVLRPGGAYLFFEHGLHQDLAVQRWQRRLNGLWMVFSGGCHMDRDPSALIRGAGFELNQVRTQELREAPRALGFMSVGRATVRTPG